MANQELIDCISERRAAGAPDEHIKTSLVSEGWSGEDVNGAFAVLTLANQPLQFASNDGFVSNHPYRNDWFSVCCIAIVIVVGGASVYGIYTAAGFSSFSSFLDSLVSAPANVLSTSSGTPAHGS